MLTILLKGVFKSITNDDLKKFKLNQVVFETNYFDTRILQRTVKTLPSNQHIMIAHYDLVFIELVTGFTTNS